MTITINATVRAAVRTVLTNSNSYDADTMVISRSGEVSALRGADKAYAGNDARRYLVGHVADMVTQDGTIRAGY